MNHQQKIFQLQERVIQLKSQIRKTKSERDSLKSQLTKAESERDSLKLGNEIPIKNLRKCYKCGSSMRMIIFSDIEVVTTCPKCGTTYLK